MKQLYNPLNYSTHFSVNLLLIHIYNRQSSLQIYSEQLSTVAYYAALFVSWWSAV